MRGCVGHLDYCVVSQIQESHGTEAFRVIVYHPWTSIACAYCLPCHFAIGLLHTDILLPLFLLLLLLMHLTHSVLIPL